MDRVIVRLGGNAIDVGRPFTSAAIQSRHLFSHLPRCQYTNSAFVVNCAITFVPGLLLVTRGPGASYNPSLLFVYVTGAASHFSFAV